MKAQNHVVFLDWVVDWQEGEVEQKTYCVEGKEPNANARPAIANFAKYLL